MSDRWPWSVLDLEEDADVAQIRKAYARRLRSVRPDDDPEGFQALREARDEALEYATCSDTSPDGRDDTESGFIEHDAHGLENAPSITAFQSLDPGTAHPKAYRPVTETIASSPPASEASTQEVSVSDNTGPEGPGPDDGRERFMELLDESSPSGPWGAQYQRWSELFDAYEKLRLDFQQDFLGDVLWVISDEIERRWHDGTVPQLYGQLRDFENRFGLLYEDTIIYNTVGMDKGRRLVASLTDAMPDAYRPSGAAEPPETDAPVPSISPEDAVIAFRQNEKLIQFHQKSFDKGKFTTYFDVLAFLFPLPWALYHRLFRLASFVAIVQILRVVPFQNYVKTVGSLGHMLAVFQLVVGVVIGFQARRMIVESAANRIKQIDRQRNSGLARTDALRNMSAPAVGLMWFGIAVVVLVSAARVYLWR